MCFPQYNLSMINYDTVANGVQGSMNLYWNQAAMHSSVYPSLFLYPTMNFGSFSPYQFNLNNNWLLNPGFALNNAFNQFGMQSSCPWFNSNPFFGGGGLSTTTSTAKTDEEFDAEEKKKELDKIISELISAEILTSNDKKKIDNAVKEAKDAGNDLVGQYEVAKAKFDELIKTKEVKIKNNLLVKGGSFKLDEGTVKDARLNLGIGSDYKVTNGLSVREMKTSVNSSNVIAFVEAFQDQHGNIIDEVIGYGNEATESDAFEQLKTALIGKARSLKSNLDSDSQEKVDNAIDNLQDCSINYNADENKTTYNPSDVNELKNRFNELYALTRITAAMKLDLEIKEKYGKHSEIFNKDLFKDNVIEDLKKSGYDIADVTVAIDEEANLDTDDMDEEEILAREKKQRVKSENEDKLNDAIKLLDAYEKTTVTVTVNGQQVSMKKLTPKEHYLNIDSEAKTYYVDLATGTVTEAKANGDYNPSATNIGFEGLKNALSFWDFAGKNCLNKYFEAGLFEKNNDDKFDVANAYKNQSAYKTIADDKEELAGNADKCQEVINGMSTEISSLIDTVANKILKNTPITEDVVDNAKAAMERYYAGILSKIKFEESDEDGETKEVKSTKDIGRGTKSCIDYRTLSEDWDEDAKETVKGYKWDAMNDSGITVVFDNDGTDSWTVFISTNVIVKKFEYFLSKEIARKS